jgi:hypothetical protein
MSSRLVEHDENAKELLEAITALEHVGAADA